MLVCLVPLVRVQDSCCSLLFLVMSPVLIFIFTASRVELLCRMEGCSVQACSLLHHGYIKTC